jgi:hypothetical protein
MDPQVGEHRLVFAPGKPELDGKLCHVVALLGDGSAKVTLEDTKKSYVLSCKRLKQVCLGGSVSATAGPIAAPLGLASTPALCAANRQAPNLATTLQLSECDSASPLTLADSSGVHALTTANDASKTTLADNTRVSPVRFTPAEQSVKIDSEQNDRTLQAWKLLELPPAAEMRLSPHEPGSMTAPISLAGQVPRQPGSGSAKCPDSATSAPRRADLPKLGTAVIHELHGQGVVVAVRNAFRPFVVRFSSGVLHAYVHHAISRMAVNIPVSPVAFGQRHADDFRRKMPNSLPRTPSCMDGYGFCSDEVVAALELRSKPSLTGQVRDGVPLMDGYAWKPKVTGLRSPEAYGDLADAQSFLDARTKRRSSTSSAGRRFRRGSAEEGFLARMGTEIGW